MPDQSHVITLVRLLTQARKEYRLMVASGFDRSRSANEELRKWSEMDEEGKQAASVWLDFLDGLEEARRYDDMQDKMESGDVG